MRLTKRQERSADHELVFLRASAVSSSRKQRICIKPWTHYPWRHIQYTFGGCWSRDTVRGREEAVGRRRGENGRWLQGGFEGSCQPPRCGNGINRAAIWLPLSQGNLITPEIYGVSEVRENKRGRERNLCTVRDNVSLGIVAQRYATAATAVDAGVRAGVSPP